ncbi:Retrovirus-related Pol polyprotein from transposon TNT 1-94 [Cardamine amara subsp. amara]|uniref:Retrovirus-related Pol polyprotein from transposon TNT 1-94 n=1 Tax=Cardamine amara subsp. amara TaxID=228776 RepID=A0ABD0ZSI8_CARAN
MEQLGQNQSAPPNAQIGHSNQALTSENNGMITMSRGDLEAMIKTMQICKESGITFLASKPSKTLLVDSGASHHMIKDPNLLNNIQNTSGDVEIANGVRVPIKGIGNLNLFGSESSAFYMPTFSNNLVSVLRSDNGGEYTSNTFKAHLAKHGILHQTSCPYTPQQNGVAERKNRHLMEVARSMMFHKNMPRRFWGDAVMTACYLIDMLGICPILTSLFLLFSSLF